MAFEPFIQFNDNAYVHSTDASGGGPQWLKALAADVEGNVAQLLGKAIDEKGLDVELTAEDLDRLKEALRGWGMLDHGMRYARGLGSDAPARA